MSNLEPLVAFWYRTNTITSTNWGDKLNPTLIKAISGQEPTHILDIPDNESYKGDIYMAIGSILEWADERFTVWGSGYISSESKVKAIPKEIKAVRGPLTRKLLIEQGIECPEVYGDPALLYPLFYKPNIKKKYKIGIIPHYVDKKNIALSKFTYDDDIKIIDILSPINTFVDELLSCEVIFSSSLHGIIAADSYGIPGYWIKFSDKLKGGRFKFDDYFMSVNRELPNEFLVTENTSKQALLDLVKDYKITCDLDKLLEVCPFRSKLIPA